MYQLVEHLVDPTMNHTVVPLNNLDFPLDINKGYVQRCTMSLLHFYVENMACSKVDSWLLPEITSCQKEEEEEKEEELTMG